jgi:hypothetical protein
MELIVVPLFAMGLIVVPLFAMSRRARMPTPQESRIYFLEVLHFVVVLLLSCRSPRPNLNIDV